MKISILFFIFLFVVECFSDLPSCGFVRSSPNISSPPISRDSLLAFSVSCVVSKFDECAPGGLYGVSRFAFDGTSIYYSKSYPNLLTSFNGLPFNILEEKLSNYFYGKSETTANVFSVMATYNFVSQSQSIPFICRSSLSSDYIFNLTYGRTNSSLLSLSTSSIVSQGCITFPVQNSNSALFLYVSCDSGERVASCFSSVTSLFSQSSSASSTDLYQVPKKQIEFSNSPISENSLSSFSQTTQTNSNEGIILLKQNFFLIIFAISGIILGCSY